MTPVLSRTRKVMVYSPGPRVGVTRLRVSSLVGVPVSKVPKVGQGIALGVAAFGAVELVRQQRLFFGGRVRGYDSGRGVGVFDPAYLAAARVGSVVERLVSSVGGSKGHGDRITSFHGR